jgi:hypothetical protein
LLSNLLSDHSCILFPALSEGSLTRAQDPVRGSIADIRR